jgi:hypothetical protein
MKKEEIEKLLELIGKAVDMEVRGGWQVKRDAVLAEASDEDKTNLSEFSGWFEDA